eukprot:TRINITY_DN22892_c0_g1_i1.p1 TRINITY_DN22892_c0_g1~~TRINITY_DN22892_c0_g1_i1.p1  ORF type:complete len:172 (+),score=16.99 TRINITY_DN22892_c0_g1_i1:217-732(+)
MDDVWRTSSGPKLLIVDLDQTMWPFDAANPRYGLPHLHGCGLREAGVQCCGAVAKPFSDAVSILMDVGAARCGKTGQRLCKIAVASANARRDVCCSLLYHLGLVAHAEIPDDGTNVPDGGMIDAALIQVYPGSKSVHFNKIAERSCISMLARHAHDAFGTWAPVTERLSGF